MTTNAVIVTYNINNNNIKRFRRRQCRETVIQGRGALAGETFAPRIFQFRFLGKRDGGRKPIRISRQPLLSRARECLHGAETAINGPRQLRGHVCGYPTRRPRPSPASQSLSGLIINDGE